MKKYRVKPGSKVKLAKWDPDDTGSWKKGNKADAQQAEDVARLADLQELLYAENQRAVLVVLQAMDTGGKDGTIRHVFRGLDPTGCRVTSFKKPSEEELDHDFLWRMHRGVPRFGEIGIFNRSHYEDVLVVRVNELVPPAVWKKRYDRINEWERDLTEAGITVVKFFLNISKDEQKERLQARLDDPAKRWKFAMDDLAARKQWDAYQAAYEDVLSKCSTEHAPWHIVPANKKWYRNLVVARTLVEILEGMAPKPRPVKIDKSIVIE
ncbi:MAG TPA: polyphosphate kinase 2 family protein [Kofleriaceae bacterium]|nr:polyphosphate kinase 2 family protein [Kofleriaceae bacterium]